MDHPDTGFNLGSQLRLGRLRISSNGGDNKSIVILMLWIFSRPFRVYFRLDKLIQAPPKRSERISEWLNSIYYLMNSWHIHGILLNSVDETVRKLSWRTHRSPGSVRVSIKWIQNANEYPANNRPNIRIPLNTASLTNRFCCSRFHWSPDDELTSRWGKPPSSADGSRQRQIDFA